MKKLVFIALLFLYGATYSQGDKKTIYFSGIVISEESIDGMPGVHIYIPKAGRGTTTNVNGFFSLPTLAEDSIIISAVGYKSQSYIIPKDKDIGFSALIHLKQDTTVLSVVEVYPYPTKELFKQAFLSLHLEDDKQIAYARKNLDEELLSRIFMSMPVDGNTSYKYYLQQTNNTLYNRGFQPNYLQFLNPFGWAQVIESIRKGGLKKKL